MTIISIFLAGFAFLQRQEAIEQRGIAEQQRAIAIEERNRAETQQHLSDSRRLAVQSLVALESGQVDLSLLLSLEAIKSADTLEAFGSLVTGIEYNPYLQTYLYDHPSSLTAVKYHPTEPIMATGAEDGSLAIWNMETLSVIHMISPTDAEIWDIDYHPDGETFAVVFDDSSIRLYESESGDMLGQVENAHDGVIITSLTYSPNGDYLLTTGYDKKAILWQSDSLLSDLPEFEVLHIDDAETTHTDWLVDAAFSPDGSQVAILAWDNVMQIWDIESRALVFEPLQLPTQTSNFSISIAWSPDGRFILMGDVVGNIRFANPADGMLIDFQLSRHFDHVREIVYSPDGSFFASVSHDGMIILWNAGNGQPLTEPISVHTNQVNGVAFSLDGKQMITVGDDGRTVLFDMTRPDLLGEHVLTQESEIYEVMYMDNVNAILSTGLDGNVYLTDTETRISELVLTPDIGRITAAALHEDTLLALATDSGGIQLWDFSRHEASSDLFTAHSATIFSLALSPDGTQLASAADDNKILFWNVDSLKTGDISDFVELDGHTDGVFDVVWHPTLPILASASRDDTIRIWDMETLETIAILEGHLDDVEVVTFNPDGGILASGGRDTDIIFWDVEAIMKGDDIIPDVIGGHDDWVLSLDFSPDGVFLASGGRDLAVNLWEVENLQLIGVALTNHDGWVWTVDVSPDSLSLASGGRSGHMVIWDVNPDNWKHIACQIANRSMSDEEWFQYLPDFDYEFTCES